MTKHIEEARKMLKEIFRFCATEDKARDIVAAALAAAEERGRAQWQPIETAPKDGTPILLGYLDKRGWFAARSALWFLVHPKHKEKDWAYAWVCPSMQTLIDNRATHWMPILAPPDITKEPTP